MKRTLLLSLLTFITLAAHSQIITTVAGCDTSCVCDGIPAVQAGLYEPTGVARDNAGNLYIADGGHNRVRKVDASGIITTIAGTGIAGYSGDNGAATDAMLSYPNGIAIDASGNIYITDDHNLRIRKISITGIITTICGTGTSGYNGDNIPATDAQITFCGGIAVDGSGNVYFTDIDNNRVRRIETVSGIITTIVGSATTGYSGDGGPATAARISVPWGIGVDGTGDIYFTEYSNCIARKISNTGVISTVAGTGVIGSSGDNVPATATPLHYPDGIEVDAQGNVYIADTYNNRIVRVNTSGTLNVVAGTHGSGYAGDGGPATSAVLYRPDGIFITSVGDLYIADWANDRIRLVRSTTSVTAHENNINDLRIYPNPSNGRIELFISSAEEEQMAITIVNVQGKKVKEVNAMTNRNVPIMLDVPDGLYMILASDGRSTVTRKVVVIK